MSTPERIRALHVDDEPEFAELTAEMLEREDDRITVTTATSAGKGLDRLADRGFDCIISDYEMPGMDGIEFLERVREEYDTLPFILFTGKGSEEVASDAIFAGVTDYLQKETGTGQYAVLANRVANAVEQYRAKQRVRERERELQRQNERLAELVEKHEAAETRYRSLFENAPIVVWEEDFSEVKERVDTLAAEVDDLEAHLEDDRETLLALADTIEINDVNEYAVEHYDAPSKEALMENLDRLATEQSYEAYKEEFLALAAGETQITLETQAWTLDGDLKDELLHVFVPEAYAGDYSRAYITATDITERKEKERALEKEREFIEQSLDTLDDIFYLVDTDGDFERWNSTLPELTGYSDDEISAMNSLEFFEGEHRETIQTSIRKILETGSHVTEAEITTADHSF